MKGEFATILILFLAIIGFSLWILHKERSKPRRGFTADYRTKLGYGPAESFTSMSYSDVNTHEAANDVDVQMIVRSPAMKCADLGGSWEQNGLFCESNEHAHILDIFSQAPGSIDCDDTSSGYHNSKGGLCLTSDMRTLLSSRGGNALGGDSQIGNA